ncbi:facilitated trehalose transporter Tret1-like [Maniola jurtina]|uniref:facilitated trehalose transporter Tret1-like n=1 Tax=Maniola jurtina TaxID=191418 RepID=UPI001E687BED|nr:facilitated trehalose transporter Tret1-like [Maniola jurtina]
MFFEITGKKRQVLASMCIYIGQLLIGFTNSWTVPILPKLQDPEQSPLPNCLTETQLSLVASLLFVGCIPGPYIMGWLSNVKGRKPCLFLGGLLAATGYVVLATAKSLAVLYCGRMLSGFGAGILAVTNVVYIGEIASTNNRGILLTGVGITTTCGSVIVLTAGYFLSYAGTTFIGAGISLAFTVATLTLPETPIFHMLKGDEKALRKVLQELGRYDDIDTLVEAKKESRELSNKKDWQELFSIRSNSRALFIVVGINILQHCSGIAPILFFASIIFDMAGSKIDASLSMIIIAEFQLIGTSISSVLIERAGRKKLLIISSANCSLSMFFLGLYFYLDHIGNPIVSGVRWLPLAILIVFFIGFECGLGIIPIVLMVEMFTSNVRSKGSAVCMTSSWVAGFLITTAFGALVETIGGHIAFWFFSGTCLCTILFSVFCVVETKGRSLLEIQEILNKK